MDCTVVELKRKLQCRRLRTTGNKAELVAILQQFESENPDYVEESSASGELFQGIEEDARQDASNSQVAELQRNMNCLLEAVATLTQKIASLEKEKNADE